jgi:O-antigen ligase
MRQKINQSQVLNPLSQLIGLTGLIVSSFYWWQGSDPVNVPKLALLGVGAFAVLGLLTTNLRLIIHLSSKPVLVGIIFFFTAMIPSLLFSEANIWQMIFGVLGRNTGLLAYSAFAILFFAAHLLQTREQITRVMKYLLGGLVFNQIISLLQIFGANPLRASDMFQTIIGTLGNPNFISAFMGISTIMAGAYVLKYSRFSKGWIIFSTLSVLSLVLVFVSDSKQGLIIVIAGAMLLIFFKILYSKLSRAFLAAYMIFMAVSILFGLLGVANKGPLAAFVYESSIGFRMRYWTAGVEMFKANFFQGVGLNSYGDWYRTARDAQSVVSPGLEVTSNSAHNIYIDYAANGGILMLLAYLFIVLLVLKNSFLAFKRLKEFDPTLVALFVGWVGYSLQGLVSIDQIGVTVCGWLLGGLVVAYCRIVLTVKGEENLEPLKEKKKHTPTSLPAQSVVSIFVFALIGGLIYFQAFLADIKWGVALRTGDPTRLSASALDWPRDEYRVGRAASIFMNNGLEPRGLELAREGVKTFPRSYSIWRLIFQNKSASIEERKLALEKMIELDPRNEELKRLLALAGPNQ